MKAIIKNISVGLAALSLLAGLVILLIQIVLYLNHYYEFSIVNTIILTGIGVILWIAEMIGKYIITEYNRNGK